MGHNLHLKLGVRFLGGRSLSPYPELIIDWRDDMTKLDSVSHRIVEPDPNFIVKKITDIGDVLVAAPSLLARLGEPKSLEDLEERFPFAAEVNVATGRTWHFPLNQERTLKPHHISFQSTSVYSKQPASRAARQSGGDVE